jgi:hypothetical protein
MRGVHEKYYWKLKINYTCIFFWTWISCSSKCFIYFSLGYKLPYFFLRKPIKWAILYYFGPSEKFHNIFFDLAGQNIWSTAINLIEISMFRQRPTFDDYSQNGGAEGSDTMPACYFRTCFAWNTPNPIICLPCTEVVTMPRIFSTKAFLIKGDVRNAKKSFQGRLTTRSLDFLIAAAGFLNVPF